MSPLRGSGRVRSEPPALSYRHETRPHDRTTARAGLTTTTNSSEIKGLTHDADLYSGRPRACHRIFALSRWTETTLLIGLLALSGSAFTYAADSWIPIGPEGGSLSALVIDPVTPSTLYAGTLGGGVFRSRNGGDSWVGINSGLTDLEVTALTIDPARPSTLYAGTNTGGVFRSTNAGESWEAINTGLTNLRVQVLAIDPVTPSTLYAGTTGGVFRSTNGGAIRSDGS